MLDKNEIVAAFLAAARKARDETPRIGGKRAHEWATVGRIAIWMARLPEIALLEQDETYLDIEYGQMGVPSDDSVDGQNVRTDILLHQRRPKGKKLLACEIKIKDARSRCVECDDKRKLEMLTTQYGYPFGIWLALPRSAESRHSGRYSIFVKGKAGLLQDLL